jgi:hypothetical protein
MLVEKSLKFLIEKTALPRMEGIARKTVKA